MIRARGSSGGMFVGQPFGQPVHRRDPARLDVLPILLRPAADLAREIIAGLAIVAEAGGLRVDAVERGDGRVHRVEIGRPLVAGPTSGKAGSQKIRPSTISIT